MKSKLYFLIGFLLFQFSLLGQTLDQSNAPVSLSGSNFTISSTQNMGQQFIAGLNGDLSQVNIRIGNFSSAYISGDFQLRIFDGNGYGGTVLNTTIFTIAAAPVTDSYEELIIPLSSLVPVSSGSSYTIDLRGISGAVNIQGTSNNYAGIMYFSQGTPLQFANDLWFKTFVIAPPVAITPATHLNFDGINDHIVLPNESAFDFTNQMTVEFWMRSNTIPQQWDALIAKGDNSWRIALTNSGTNVGRINFGINTGSGVTSTTSVIDGTWHHVAVSYGGGTARIVVDGVQQISIPASVNFNNNNFNVSIAENLQATGRYYAGDIDDIRIWNISKSTAEINSNKNCELTGNETGLVAYYKFNQGIGGADNSGISIANDATPNANNGTLTNFTLNNSISNWVSGSPIFTPTIPTLASDLVIYNQGDTAASLSATSSATGLLWYTTAIGGIGSSTAPTPSTSTPGNIAYWVSSTNANDCESERVKITVIVNGTGTATHLNFDGTNDYVVLPNESNFDFTNQMTVEFWMNSNVIPQQWDAFVAKGDDSWRVALTSTGTVGFAGNGAFTDFFSTTSVTDGNWHHVAVTYDGANAIIYIDGILENSISATGNFDNSAFNVSIGENLQQTGRFYNGNLDDLRIWNVARTNLEIDGNKNCGIIGSETGLVAYYNFNQGNDAANNATVTTLIDYTTNANNGNLNNFGLTGTTSNWISGSPVFIPSAPVASNQSFCDSSNATVADLVPATSSGFLWYSTASGGTPLADTTVLTEATYYVSEINANGCESSRTTVQVSIISLIISSQTNLTCYGTSTGSATIAASDGSGLYDILWSNGNTNATASGLSAGAYTVTAFSSALSCQISTSVTITQPAPFAVSLTKNDITCNGANDGTASGTVTGGTPPYTYLWSNGAATNSVTGLAPGVYSFYVYDSLGCTTYPGGTQVSIVEPSVLALPTVTSPVNYYQGATATALTATSSATGLLWYTTAIGGTGTTTAPIPDTSALGSVSYWVSSTNANGCESNRVEVVVVTSTTATHLHLDGVNDYLGVTISSTPTYTKEVWIKPNDFTGERQILSCNQISSVENHIWLDNGILKAGNKNYPGLIMSDNVVLPLNTWTHIAVTVDESGNVSKLYKNGILIDTHTNVGQLISVMYIGAQDVFGNDKFSGEIDEVRIWNIALSQEQIIGRMYCELNGNENGLTQYFKFNEGIANGDNTNFTQIYETVSGTNVTNSFANFNLSGTSSNRIDGSPIISGISNPNLPITTSSYTYQVGDVATPLTATSAGTGLLWYDNLVGTGSITAPVVDTSNPGLIFYWVSSTNANGCTSERIKITVNVLPSLDYGCWKVVETFNHTIAIANNGTLWAWGKNTTGELGLNDTTDRLIPTQVGTDSNWDKIAVGFSHSMALKTDGTLWTWGDNTDGQLGHGDNTGRQIPTQVGTATDWFTINTKYQSSFAIKQNKTLWAWGRNSINLGTGNATYQNSPIQIGGDSDWEKIAVNQRVSFAIKSNGTLWSSGQSNYNGLSSNVPFFTQVGSDSDWKNIFNGHSNIFALKNDNTLWHAGLNTQSDGGFSTAINLPGTTFNKVLSENWAYVGSGNRYTLAIKTDGTLWAWGSVAKSIFGVASPLPYEPIQIGTDTNWQQISSGISTTLGNKTDSSIWSGGSNISGVLGLGDTTTRNQFEQVSCPCADSTIWNGTIWSNGFPDATKQVIFNGNYTGIGFSACSVQVNGTSIVLINSDETLHVQGIVTVAATATLEFQNNAYLVQVSNVTNIGNIKMHRESAPMIRLDYTAWSSPVSGQNLLNFSPLTLTNRFYTYEPSGTTTVSAWIPVADPSSTNFTTGQGYLIRSANNWNATVLSPYSGLFEGVPNNGDITIPVTVGYNLLGNPYPSPIDNFQFITQNQGLGVNTLYYWTHTVPASGGVYPLNNYASYSKAGGVAAAAGGYKPVGLTQVGQGFISNINSVGNVGFKNNLRQAQSSGQFFRSESTIERHRIWLNLSDATNEYNQMMIAYMTGATNGFDQGIDGLIFTNSNTNIASILNNERYVIQGRTLVFEDNDEVPLSFTANQDGNYKISLDSFDGLFESQEIYIWDKLVNIKHDIKQSEYNFNSNAGTFNERFSIVYKNGLLSNEDFEGSNNLIVFINSSNQIIIEDSKNYLETVEIYDVSGRQLFSKNGISSNEFNVLNSFGNQVLLVRVTNENGIVLTKKVLK
ncbi:LamG-like jellyroll fold domain-containing protein [Flavobacterium sp.]|uniref:LamG-like jellyroll fold domain-containing protein n=1 Tax=Flavobacterium sp. TaxID=239 RepID=UPI003D27BA95